MNDPETYSRKWDEYHRRQRLFLFAWVAYIPGVLIFSWLIRSATSVSSWHAGLISFVIFGGCAMLARSTLSNGDARDAEIRFAVLAGCTGRFLLSAYIVVLEDTPQVRR